MTTPTKTNSIHRSPLRRGLLLIPLAFVCFALTPASQAVTPAPDGGYTGGNTAEGADALLNLDVSLGIQNTGIGRQALLSNVSGDNNTAIGFQALRANIATNNTATGFQALINNTSGINNIAVGGLTLTHITTPSNNTAVGWKALQVSNPIGHDPSTAVGSLALLNNTSGEQNTAVGFKALLSNTDGPSNTAFGQEALSSNTHGDSNNATGFQALFSNTTGVWNEAYGFQALHDNVIGRENTAIGDSAGNAITGSFNINIGSAVTGGAGENNTIRIGDNLPLGGLTSAACFIGGISGETALGGDPVSVTSDGKLGTITVVSSARFKDEIKPMDKASEVILALKPVTFRYKKEFDPKGIPQFGLVAEEVEKVNPSLVKRDRDGKLQTVRYDAVNAMLLNEFLKEHRKVQGLEATVAQQQKGMEVLTAQLKEQAAQIQKVSAQLEVNKRAPRTVANK